MRVGVASHGATGHIYPLLGFADVLLAAGHDVIILTGSNLVPWLTDLGYAAEAVGETIGWGAAQVQSRFPELTTSLPAEQAWRFDAELFADALTRAMAPALVTASTRDGQTWCCTSRPTSALCSQRPNSASRRCVLIYGPWAAGMSSRMS
jgi:UDP:flavonoid glycosyltransferase YjiC (YdhE family)